MVTIHRIGNLTISVYADHAPPHFHVYGCGAESRVDLATMLEIGGEPAPAGIGESHWMGVG